jgi:hypothetical protein
LLVNQTKVEPTGVVLVTALFRLAVVAGQILEIAAVPPPDKVGAVKPAVVAERNTTP